MLTFKIYLNGKQIGVAGSSDLSVLTQIVSAVGKLGPESQGPQSGKHELSLELTASGLTARKDEPSMNVSWIRKELKIGDRISLEIEESDEADAPIGPEPVDLEDLKRLSAEQEKRRFEWAKVFYLENKDKFEN